MNLKKIVNNKTQIKTSLPYCLYRIDSRFFKINDGFNSKIRFNNIETTPNRRCQSYQNAEIIRDRWGIEAHSDVDIYTNRIFAQGDEAIIFTLKILNDFIRRYRYYDKEAIHLIQLTKEDLFEFSVITNGHGLLSISFAGRMTVVNPLRNYEISTKIENSLLNGEEIQLREELLINAEQYLFQAEYRHSILESIIALELVISEFIRLRCREKKISKTDANKFIKDIGLTGNIKVTLKFLIDKTKLPDNKIFEKCKASITLRNQIVHEGRQSILASETQDALKYSKMLIEFLVSYL